MQCDLLTSNFKNPKTTALMQETIGQISDGSSPYCASVLKLGFKKAFEVKKRESVVLLRCSNTNCGWHNNPVAYSSVGANVYCPSCSNNGYNNYNNYNYGYNQPRYYMQCADCRYQRTSNFTSCQSCGRRFV
jgi:hypothetical protein